MSSQKISSEAEPNSELASHDGDDDGPASVHYLVAATLLGEPVTSDMADERGPDDVKSKDDVLKYLAGSFTALRRAVDTLTDENAFASIKGVFGAAPDTRVGLIIARSTAVCGASSPDRTMPLGTRVSPGR